MAWQRTIWGAVLALLVAGCAKGHTPSDGASETVAGGGAEVVAGEVVEVAAEAHVGPALPDLTGRTYRVDELWATSPTDAINDAWAAMVADYTLVLLVHVVQHDPAGGLLTLDIGSGWAERESGPDGSIVPLSYQFGLEPVRVTATVTGLTFVIDELFELDLFPETVNKPFHIERIIGQGIFSEEGNLLKELSLDGLLRESEVIDFCLLVPGLGSINFHGFMNLLGVCPNADADGDGTVDAYRFIGGVIASDASALFLPGSHPVEPLISECEEHVEPCN